MSLNANKMLPKLVGVILLLPLLGFGQGLEPAQQQHERIIRRLPAERNEPIQVTQMRLKGLVVNLNEQLLADDDWLKALTITIKNTSDKPILFATVEFRFPRSSATEGRMALLDTAFGNRALQKRLPEGTDNARGLMPGQTVDLQLSPDEIDLLRHHLPSGYPSGIEKVDLKIGKIIFNNETMWYSGSIFRRDSSDPGNWINTQSTTSNQNP